MNQRRETIAKEEFPKRLKFLMDNHTPRVTHKSLADAIGSERQNISAYLRGVCLPKAGLLAEIAAYFSVSTDWLLGVGQGEMAAGCPDELIVKAMHDSTGLSKSACAALVHHNVDVEIINRLLENAESIDALRAVTDAIGKKEKNRRR